MEFTKDDKYKHEILVVCALLAGECSGSYDPVSDESMGELRRWLKWRITDSWTPNVIKRMEIYEEGVRMLALCALHLPEER